VYITEGGPAGQSIALQDLFGPVSDPASSSNEKSSRFYLSLDIEAELFAQKQILGGDSGW